MVRAIIFIILFLFAEINAADFVATVNRNQVNLGESFRLTLSLIDATAISTPNVNRLKKDFTVHSQQKSSNTVITNGKMSSSTNWILTLLPKSEGQLIIPSIDIDTKEGLLTSRPIQIQVTKNQSSSENGGIGDGITLTASVSNAEPFKGEPITYTVKLISRYELANINVEKLNVENAIVETLEEPEIRDAIVDGVKIKVLEVSTLITPLKEGSLTIPPIVIQGGIPVKRQSRTRSFFDDDFDPFQMMRGFSRLEPFALSTEPVVLEVQPPVPEIFPWLPAKSMQLKESWDESQELRVGEPFTFTIKIDAVGLRASQLPSIKDYLTTNTSFKIYADKPETGERIVDHEVQSYRSDQFTLIPNEPGVATLPEIIIPWWDTTTNSAKYARIAEKQLSIEPATAASAAPNVETPSTGAQESVDTQQVVVTQNSRLMYIVIAILVMLLVIAFLWIFALQRKINRLTNDQTTDQQEHRQPILHIALRDISTAKQLFEFLQGYSHNKWGTSKNGTIQVICSTIKQHSPEEVHKDLKEIEKSLENTLYKGAAVDIDALVRSCSVILDHIKETKSTKQMQETLPELNPK